MILGIDPGLENTGWGVLQSKIDFGRQNKSEYELVECGVILTSNKDKSEDRLAKIFKEIQKIIKKYKVEEVAMESLFFAKNVRSAMSVAEAIGVIKVAAKTLGIEVFEYTPLQIKQALVGYGRAEKEQVELMVRDCLSLEEPISPGHASDAVAAALTHSFTSAFVRE